MKLPCIVRAGVYGAIFRSFYDLSTGNVDGVPSYLLHYIAPPTVKRMFTDVDFDVPFTDTTLSVCSSKLVGYSYLSLVFADFGNHVFSVYDRIISIDSINVNDGITVSNTEECVLFNTKSYVVGRYRQKIITFDVPTSSYQLLIVFEMPDGKLIYYDGEKFSEVTWQFDYTPDFSKLNVIELAKHPNENVIGSVLVNGEVKFIERGS